MDWPDSAANFEEKQNQTAGKKQLASGTCERHRIDILAVLDECEVLLPEADRVLAGRDIVKLFCSASVTSAAKGEATSEHSNRCAFR